MLFRLIYSSQNHLSGNDSMIAGLNSIFAACERNNARDEIIEALLFETLWFVQILRRTRARVRHVAPHSQPTSLTRR